MKPSCRFTLCLAVSIILSAIAAAQSLTVTDIGSLNPGGPFDVSYGYALNTPGHVAGSSYTPDGFLHAILWTRSSGLRDLGTFGGQNSTAFGINDSGQVVGQADLASGATHAFLWSSSKGMQDLGTLGGLSSYAYAINRLGQVVGQAYLASGNPHAFLWSKTAGMIDLGTLGGTASVAYAINDLGEVVGSSNTAGDLSYHAFLWTQSAGMQDLGTIQSSNPSYALGINHSGKIVGYAGTTQLFEWTYGFLWTPSSGLQSLPFRPGSMQDFPMAINDLNQITGQFTNASGDPLAFLDSKSTGIQDLNTLLPANSGWILDIGTAINRKQQITGWGPVTINGAAVNHAFLLTRLP